VKLDWIKYLNGFRWYRSFICSRLRDLARIALYAMNARSSWRRALTSSPPNPIFSFGISRGPSAEELCACAPFGLAVGPPWGPAEPRGASAAPFTNELIPGTAFPALDGSAAFGDLAIGLRECSDVGCSCFGRRGLCVWPFGAMDKDCTETRGDAMRGSTRACP
jgi:hypothetical protein